MTNNGKNKPVLMRNPSCFEKVVYQKFSKPFHPSSDLSKAKFPSIHSMVYTLMDFSLRLPHEAGPNFWSLMATRCSGELEEPHNIIVSIVF